jgi:hypothetical protein
LKSEQLEALLDRFAQELREQYLRDPRVGIGQYEMILREVLDLDGKSGKDSTNQARSASGDERALPGLRDRGEPRPTWPTEEDRDDPASWESSLEVEAERYRRLRDMLRDWQSEGAEEESV